MRILRNPDATDTAAGSIHGRKEKIVPAHNLPFLWQAFHRNTCFQVASAAATWGRGNDGDIKIQRHVARLILAP